MRHPRQHSILAFIKVALRWTLELTTIFLLAVLTHSYALGITRMVSGSMAPTLDGDASQGDVVLIDKLTYRLRDPRRGEVVAFLDSDGMRLLKRVVGLPEETLEVVDGNVSVNGDPIQEPPAIASVHYTNEGYLGRGKKAQVVTGAYFVLGDDSEDSYDSRYWGSLARSCIRGRALARVWPPHRVGLVR